MTTSKPSQQGMFGDGSEETLELLPTPRASEAAHSGRVTMNHDGQVGLAEWANNALNRGFSPQATPASHSQVPGKGPERMTPGTSGRGFASCLPRLTPTVLTGFVSKMSEGTSAWASTVCSLTWTTSATPARRGLFLLRLSARSTKETASGSSGAETIWPTPTVQDGANNAGPSQWERNSDPLNVAVHRDQPALQGQKLNPAFVTRLMGYPDDWLDLSEPSAADGSTASPSPSADPCMTA